LREELQDRLMKEGLDALSQLLLRLDPVSYEKVDLKNHMRVLKALEISIQTGKPYSTFLLFYFPFGHKKRTPLPDSSDCAGSG